MLIKLFQIVIRITLWVSVISLLALAAPRLITAMYAWQRTYSPDKLPAKPENSARAAIVFGAGLRRDGSPTAVLRDRIQTAAELFFAGKVDRLLMSGDNRFENYNEPGAMRTYALNLGVPDEAIVLDYAGRRTYDTCYRAAHIFGVQQAVVVTQPFHLPRALYTCAQMGIETYGVPAARYRYLARSLLLWNIRETFATAVALLDIHITKPLPVLGSPQPIFPVEAQ
jgi:SanA protein